MPKTGNDLGVELGKVYTAGRQLLPQVADELHIAATRTNPGMTTLTARSGGLGADPAPGIDRLLTELQGAVLTTEKTLRDVGTVLVDTADHYASTDAAAKAVLDETKARVDGVPAVAS